LEAKENHQRFSGPQKFKRIFAETVRCLVNMEKDLGKVKKNDNTDIVVRIDDFGGKIGLTIREFTTSERYTGFTKSGTRISQENFKEFKNLINSIDENEFMNLQAEPKEEKPKAEKTPAKATKKKIEDIPEEDLL